MSKICTILIGTPEFAEKIFRKFYNVSRDKFKIIAVITAEDKPVGRKQILTSSPVKKWAQENNLPILQPDRIKNHEWFKKIKELKPDLIVLAAYGQIIPKEILGMPKYGSLNIHPSLLPKYRGASPIQATILNGDKEAGVTIILMDEKMDHGPIITNYKLQITNYKTTHEKLSEKLADLGAELLIKTLPDWIEGRIKPQIQDDTQATFCKVIKKEDGKIRWDKSAEEIERQIRALNPWPGTWTEIKNSKLKIQNYNLKLKILEADFGNKNTDHEIGEVFLDRNKDLCAQAGNGVLILKQVQLEGKKPMPVKDFLNGYPEIIGTILK